MSSKSGIKIKICEKVFTDLEDLAIHMTKLLDDFTNNQDDAVRKYLIKALSSFKDCMVFGHNIEVYKYLKSEDFPNVCIELMKMCMRKEDVKLQSALLSCLITMTDNSNDMCEMLLDASFADLVIEQMIQIFDREFKSKLPKSITKKDFYDQLILTVDNIINRPSYQRIFTCHPKIEKFKELISTFLKSSDARTCILTMVGLTYLIDGEIDDQQLELFKTVIDSCIEYIGRGMKHDERRCEGIRIVELMSLLETLSNMQCIKNYMIGRPPVMDLIHKILVSTKVTDEEKQKTLGIMQNLSFKDVGKRKSKSESANLPDILCFGELARPFLKSSDDITQQVAGSIVSLVYDDTVNNNTEQKYDIFVSYYHADKEKMLKLVNKLKHLKFKLSLSSDVNKGTVDNNMKQLIGQSKVFMVGISNSYYNKAQCRTECQYAYETNKPIIALKAEPKYKARDWLKEILGTAKCFDFPDGDEFESFSETVVKHLKETLHDVGSVNDELRYSWSDKNLKEWSKEDVSDWARLNNLSLDQSSQLAECDGSVLEYLRSMKKASSEQYYARLKDDLKLSLNDEVIFDKAIHNINR